MQRAVSAHKLTESGMKAVIAAVDPFHDKPIEGYKGWPDLETAPSVRRHFKVSTTIKAIEAGGSIMISSSPMLDQAVCYLTTRRNAVVDTIVPGVSTNFTIAPVVMTNFTAAQSGAFPLPLTGAETYFHTIPEEYFTDGPCRITGMGIEVHDVTADIYKQGTITICEVPQSTAEKEAVTVKAQTVAGQTYASTAIDICPLSRFPSSLAGMMSYPTTKQWDAKEGAYVVIPFTGHENPPCLAEYRQPWLNANSQSEQDLPNQLNTLSRYIGAYAAGGTNGDPFVFNAHFYSPMHTRSIYITGLNENSTFTVTTQFYLESFPLENSPLQSLADPSCPFDPKALALISHIMQEMPVGVPVRENPLGEWFWSAVESVLPFLGVAASAIFPEFSPMIAAAAASGAQYASRQLAKPKPRKRKEKKAALKNEIKQVAKSEAKQVVAQSNRKKKKQILYV